MQLSERLHIPQTATGKMNDLALKKKQAGIPVFNFSAGDPTLPVDPAILEGVHHSLAKHQQLVAYPPIAGLTELRRAAGAWMARYQTPFSLEETLVTNGGKFALYAVAQVLINRADEILVAAPYWVSYLPIIHLAEGQPRIIMTEEKAGWKLTPTLLEAARSSRTKMLILNNGCNPTGVLYNQSELRAILSWAKKHHIFVLSDEVYSEVVYDNLTYVSVGSFPEFRETSAIVQSCAKNFCMTGWRVGFVFAPARLIEALAKFQGHTLTGTSTVSQWAALAALKDADRIAKTVCQEMARRRDLFTSTFNRLFSTTLRPPPSAIYQFVSLQQLGVSHSASQRFCEEAIEQAAVALVPGNAFGVDGYVRFAFSEDEGQIVQGLEALAHFCKTS